LATRGAAAIRRLEGGEGRPPLLGESTMARKLTPAALRARANAYEEAAEHLELAWTDDPSEREEGDRLSRTFHAECARLRAIACAREIGGPRLAPLGAAGEP